MNLQLEPFVGISGNMFLALLLDLGAREEVLRRELAKVDFAGYEIQVSHLEKNGIHSCYVDVICSQDHDHAHNHDHAHDHCHHDHDHNHHHDHDHHHGHRDLKTILDLIDRSGIKDRVRRMPKISLFFWGKVKPRSTTSPWKRSTSMR